MATQKLESSKDFAQALQHLEAVLDGAEGYVSERGDGGPYWNDSRLIEAREFLDKHGVARR